MWKYLIAWFPMILIAIANGAVREEWYGKRIGELKAHQVSTISALVLFGIYIWIVTGIWPPESAEQALRIGLMWLGLTLAFEFLFGHYVAGHSWSRLFGDYNLLAGRLWLMVPIFLTIAPYIFFRFQQKP